MPFDWMRCPVPASIVRVIGTRPASTGWNITERVFCPLDWSTEPAVGLSGPPPATIMKLAKGVNPGSTGGGRTAEDDETAVSEVVVEAIEVVDVVVGPIVGVGGSGAGNPGFVKTRVEPEYISISM